MTPISVSLGYDNKNEIEFSGYIVSTSIENGILRVFCEDATYLLRKEVKNRQLAKATVVEIAEQIVQKCTKEGARDIRRTEEL